jgi:hypothetical protein
MDITTLWPVALEALQALGRHYGPEMDRVAAELKLPEWYGWLLPALVFEPEPTSATRLRVRSPYTSARLYHERLTNATKQGFMVLLDEAEGAYRLTELGKRAAECVIRAAYTKMAMLQPMPSDELERLAGFLRRLVMSCLEAPEPPGKWCIAHSRKTDPGDNAPVLVRVDQYLSDLAAYRDDAHLAAWQPYCIDGHAWEAFTYLWRGQATTLNEIFQKLERRGYSRDEYSQALEDLIRRGWVEGKEVYQITTLGKEIRQTAEETTDRYFYAPWSCLTEAEMEDLRDLLIRLRDGL